MRKTEIESWVADVAGYSKSWLAELEQNAELIEKIGDRFPSASRREHDALRDRLRASIS